MFHFNFNKIGGEKSILCDVFSNLQNHIMTSRETVTGTVISCLVPDLVNVLTDIPLVFIPSFNIWGPYIICLLWEQTVHSNEIKIVLWLGDAVIMDGFKSIMSHAALPLLWRDWVFRTCYISTWLDIHFEVLVKCK